MDEVTSFVLSAFFSYRALGTMSMVNTWDIFEIPSVNSTINLEIVNN